MKALLLPPRKALLIVALLGSTAAAPAVACPPARADYSVESCGQYYNEGVFSAALPPGGSVTAAGSGCPDSSLHTGYELQSSVSVNAAKGRRGAWQADAPTGLEIIGASVPAGEMAAVNVNGGAPWGGGVYWAGGGHPISTGTVGGSWSGFTSPYFGFQIICGASTCHAGGNASLSVYATSLDMRETTGPSLSAPNGLWQSKDWVRGQWPLNFSGSSPSGMCGLNGTLNQIPVSGTSSARDVAAWHQCSAPAVSDMINTAAYGQGAMPLYIAGWDAAGRTVGYRKTVYVDNSTPTLSLNGPTDAPTTAGTQYVTATAGGSPSGIDGIYCSIDGAPDRWYAGATAQVPVSGAGEHRVTCKAFDDARAANGAHAASAQRSWSLKIGVPTELGVGFLKYVGLKCHKVKRRVTIPGHWVTRHRHGKKIRVKTHPKHKLRKITRCHPRVKHVRVVVRVPKRRDGKIVRHHGHVVYRRKVERKRVVVTPHWKNETKRHVPHGRSTTVSGWLGLSDGTALAGNRVEVLTAPDNGFDHFRVAATATTAANGAWTATLPAGPSRVVEASYVGGARTESTVSGQVKVIVPAKIKLRSVTPDRVAWGQKVRIKGQILGGYLPSGGINVRLRYGIANAKTTYGVHEHVGGRGRFATMFRFGPGDPRDHRRFWFQIATLPAGNYPYSQSHSKRIYVEVGGHPRRHHGLHHRRHRHDSHHAARQVGSARDKAPPVVRGHRS